MKELKTKKSAEGARVKEKSDALPRAAKRMLRAGLMERQASRQRDTQEKAPERAAEEQVERACAAGGGDGCGRRPGGIQAGCASAGRTGKGTNGRMQGSRPLSLCITGRAYRWCGTEQRKFPEIGKF